MNQFIHKRSSYGDNTILLKKNSSRTGTGLVHKDNRPLRLISFNTINPSANSFQAKKPLQLKHTEQDSPVQLLKEKYGPITKPGKKSLLLGTTHGLIGKDLSGEVPGDMQSNTSYILEYPPLHGTGATTFPSSTVGSINDKTQKSLAEEGTTNEASHNIKSIGADGRKAYKNGVIHSVSLRHKVEGDNGYKLLKHDVIPISMLYALTDKYVDRCLRLAGGDAVPIANKLGKLVQYTDGTDLEHVMMNTYGRMKTISSGLALDRRKSIKRKVMTRLQQEMTGHINDYRQNKDEYKANNFLGDLITETNTNLVGSLHDSMANLLLYTEVLAAKTPNVVVAYGADHLAPLNQLLNETPATRRKKKVQGKKY